jgi:DNA-directed RNA polymerase subunit RPC12/RpoP
MISFGCPRCKTFLTRLDQEAGGKMACPSCGQRLQIPTPPHKTVLGELIPPTKTRLGELAAPTQTPPASSAGLPAAQQAPGAARMAVTRCPECRRSLDVPEDLIGCWVECPECTERFVAEERQSRTFRRGFGRRRRRGTGWNGRCPFCGTKEPPIYRTEISQTGWIIFVVMLVVFFPLFFIGLLMKEEVAVCPECGGREGGSPSLQV